ncbi:MAG: DUF4038 domain-containing protein, partial [Bryobacteraceae bacterium]
SLTPAEFNDALNYHLKKYGPMPYGQPVTSLIDHSTYTTFGHTDKAPWITLHSVGNRPRNNAMYPAIEDLFRLPSPNPAVDLEPYYSNWDNAINKPAGEHPAENSDRDNYFARSMMYGCVLSGGLVGHVYGHGAYDITTTDEPPGARPYIWTALKYTAGAQMQWMKKFFLSEGRRYQDLLLANDEITPRKAPDVPDNGLDGLSLMMRTKEKDLAFLYFENKALRASLAGWAPDKSYRLTWYDPRKGEWASPTEVSADAQGIVKLPPFPGGADIAETDWAAKLVLAGANGSRTTSTSSN